LVLTRFSSPPDDARDEKIDMTFARPEAADTRKYEASGLLYSVAGE
jgi:hypothetical protein